MTDSERGGRPVDGHRRLLVVSHDASRTGAPLVLLGVVRWLVEHTDVRPTFVLGRDGPLTPAFRALGPTRVLAPAHRPSAGAAGALALDKLGFARPARVLDAARLRLRLASLRDHDAVLVSSAASASIARQLPGGRPLVCRIAELPTVLDQVDAEDLAWLLDAAARIVAVSPVVADNLVAAHGVPRERITWVPPFVAAPPPTTPEERVRARAALGVGEGDLLVGAVGTLSWRKGPDLFLRLAGLLRDRRPDLDVHLRWVGADPVELASSWLPPDAARSGVEDRVAFLPPQRPVWPFLHAVDVFVVPAREDPYPVAALEAAATATPVVSFATTGVADLLAPDGRVPVALDLEALADRVIELLDDPECRADVGRRTAERLGVDHDLASVATALHRELADVLR